MSRPFDPDDPTSPTDESLRDAYPVSHAPYTTKTPTTPDVEVPATETNDYIEAEYVEEGYTRHPDASPLESPPESTQHASHHSVRDTLTRIPDALGALGRTLERAISAKDEYVVAVKVSAEAQAQLEKLVQAGVFRSRAEAAAYLIDEGIIAQAALFARVDQKLSEIERLRAELRGMVGSNPNEGS